MWLLVQKYQPENVILQMSAQLSVINATVFFENTQRLYSELYTLWLLYNIIVLG